jgi:hypothetical protein
VRSRHKKNGRLNVAHRPWISEETSRPLAAACRTSSASYPNGTRSRSISYLHQQGFDTTAPAGKAMFQMLGTFAEFERAIIRERVVAGMARAKAKARPRAPRAASRLVGRPSIPRGVRPSVRPTGLVVLACERWLSNSVLELRLCGDVSGDGDGEPCPAPAQPPNQLTLIPIPATARSKISAAAPRQKIFGRGESVASRWGLRRRMDRP